MLKHSFATVAVATGLLAATASASAGTHQSVLVGYNGHAGLGASVDQRNQTAGITDGTSNTVVFGARAATPAGFSIAADGRAADHASNVDLAGPFVPNN